MSAHHATRRLLDARDDLANATLTIDRRIRAAMEQGQLPQANDLRSVKSHMASALAAIDDAADMIREGGGEA